MSELEKLKAAQEVLVLFRSDVMKHGPNLASYLANEIARLKGPHAEAKRLIDHFDTQAIEEPWQLSANNAAKIVAYVRHLENERDHYKIQCQHAKKAEVEPLDPKRVLATAAKVLDHECNAYHESSQNMIRGIMSRSEKAKPYEVKNE